MPISRFFQFCYYTNEILILGFLRTLSSKSKKHMNYSAVIRCTKRSTRDTDSEYLVESFVLK